MLFVLWLGNGVEAMACNAAVGNTGESCFFFICLFLLFFFFPVGPF